MKDTIIWLTWFLLLNIVPIHNKKRRGGSTKLFHDHDYFYDEVSLYDLCMKYDDHKEVIHEILKSCFVHANITTSTLGDMFDSFR